MRDSSAILERNKKGERGGGKTLLASDNSEALNFLSVGRKHFNPHLEGDDKTSSESLNAGAELSPLLSCTQLA